MREISMMEIDQVSGGSNNVGICQGITTIAGGVIGGVIGAYGTFGFGTSIGAGWGASAGGVAGSFFCPAFFAD